MEALSRLDEPLEACKRSGPAAVSKTNVDEELRASVVTQWVSDLEKPQG